ncbi:MAG: membrane protein of unknown function [Methanothrix sp.]|jgi:hypothetical protein|nr:MAG: membrane protein of unknown function [Methanothrix sp.]
MVFVLVHCVPSFIAGVLILLLYFKFSKKNHRFISFAIIIFGIIDLIGYIYEGRIRFFPLDLFTFHAWIDLTTFLLSIYMFVNGIVFHKSHCYLGRVISLSARIALITGMMLFFGLTFQ